MGFEFLVAIWKLIFRLDGPASSSQLSITSEKHPDGATDTSEENLAALSEPTEDVDITPPPSPTPTSNEGPGTRWFSFPYLLGYIIKKIGLTTPQYRSFKKHHGWVHREGPSNCRLHFFKPLNFTPSTLISDEIYNITLKCNNIYIYIYPFWSTIYRVSQNKLPLRIWGYFNVCLISLVPFHLQKSFLCKINRIENFLVGEKVPEKSSEQ